MVAANLANVKGYEIGGKTGTAKEFFRGKINKISKIKLFITEVSNFAITKVYLKAVMFEVFRTEVGDYIYNYKWIKF